MKKLLILNAFLLALLSDLFAQNLITVSGDISSNTVWTNNNIYLLSGFVYVTGNSELTIEPGTVIKGDKGTKGSLIITRGSKIYADGTVSQPIVFTSNEPAGTRSYGDWGGIIICGKAPINDPAGEKVIEGGVDAVKGLYGGIDPADNSGILRYVRIEFPGIAFMPNNEINGLTCGGVGSSTIIDYVQVSYSGDDSYECFGGTVNMKHLIAYRGLDDDFDTDYGFSGKGQFLVSLRDSSVADISGSNGFESDNDATGTTNLPFTHPIYSNVTIIGPINSGTTGYNSNYKRAAHIRRSAKTSIFNSALAGFPTGLLIDGANCETNATNNELLFRNNFLAGCSTPLSVASGSTWDISNWFNQVGFNDSIIPASDDLLLTDPFNYNSPDFLPLGGSSLLNSADFSNSSLNDPFFDIVTYRGAFGNTDWTSGWANYDCQNTIYTGIKSLPEIKGAVTVYPNPANENFMVNFQLAYSSTVKIKLCDLQGRILLVTDLGFHSIGSISEQIDISEISKGLYSLLIETTSGVQAIQINKQ